MTLFIAAGPLRLSGAMTAGISATTTNNAGQATGFTLTGPTTGVPGVAATYTVTPNGALGTTTVVTPAASNGGVVSPSTLTFTSGTSAAQTFTVTRATVGTSVVTATSSPQLGINPAPINFTASLTATLSGPTTAIIAVAQTYRITLNAAASQTYTFSVSASAGASGTATLSTSAPQISTGQTSVDFTVTWGATGSDKSVTMASSSTPSVSTYSGSPISVVVSVAGSSTGELPANTISTGTTVPVGISYGQAFKEGAVGSGAQLSGRQLNVISTWPSDGSCKVGIVSRVVSGDTSHGDTLSIGTAASGATITTTDLRNAMTQAVSIGSTSYGTVTWSGADWEAPFASWATGPVMSSWIYRKVMSDTQLVAWLEVRMWSTGAVEVFPWIENGTLLDAGVVKTSTFTFSMGGSTRFSKSMSIYHHTRIPLIDHAQGYGSTTTFSHWLGTDPAPRVVHDTAYLMATKLLPNIGYGAPASATLNALVQTYTPNTLAGDTNANGDQGGAGSIIAPPSAYYLTSSADMRAWKGMMTHGLSSGSWSHHYRDGSTLKPFKFSDYPNIRIGYTDSQSIPAVPGGDGNQNAAGPSPTHLPGYAYVPFLTTGRFWFLEEAQFWATYCYGGMNRNDRLADDGIYASGQVRYRAWGLNMLAQAATITPSSDSLRAEFVASWEANMDWHKRTFVDGTNSVVGEFTGGTWVHPQGYLGTWNTPPNSLYSADTISSRPYWYDGAWQHNYVAAVLGYSSDIGIPQSTQSASDHVTIRNHAYKQQITRAGDGISGKFNWRRFIAYAYPIGGDDVGLPTETKFTGAQSYAECLIGFGLTDLTAYQGLSLKRTMVIPANGGEDDLVPGVASLDYMASGLAALSLAVEHAAPGAVEGLSRVTGASNFASATLAFYTDQNPNWAIRPRQGDPYAVPSWMGAAGQWNALPSGTWVGSDAYLPNGYITGFNANGRYAYSGGVVNLTGVYRDGVFVPGMFFIGHGGGHGDHSGNEVVAYGPINSSAPEWFRVSEPTNPPPDGNSGARTGGYPTSTHTYDVIQWVPSRNEMVRLGNPSPYPNGGGTSFPVVDAFRFNVTGSNPWTTADTGYPGTITGINAVSAVDTDTGYVWQVTNQPGYLVRYDPATQTSTSWSLTNTLMGGGKAAMDPRTKVFVCVDSGGVVRCLDLRSPTASIYSPSTTGSGPASSSLNMCVVWDEIGQRFIVWPNTGKTIYFLTPPSNPYSGGGSWTWSSATPAGGSTPASAVGHAVFGRFNIVSGAAWTILMIDNDASGNFLYYRLR